jgi:hypothetical protein
MHTVIDNTDRPEDQASALTAGGIIPAGDLTINALWRA